MARRSVNIFFNGKTVAESIKLANKEMRALKFTIDNSKKGSDDYVKAVKRYSDIKKQVRDHRKELNGISSTYDKIKGSVKAFVGVQLAAFGAREIIGYGKELFRLGTEMEVLTKKAKTVFGEALPLVEAAAKSNAAAMGLTTSQYTNATAAIGDLLIPMGFQREEAANISTNLVDLSGALSEWTGGQKSAKEVTDILGKAILGEREQLKTLGISIQEADVKARLAEKGLDKLTGASLQQAKAAATLELITEKSGDAQAAFAANSDTLVRKQAELGAKFEDIKESMATALIPVFHRLMGIVEPIVATIADMVIAMLKGKKATGKLSGGMKIVATVLGNVGNIIGFVFGAFKKLGVFLLDNFGGTIEFIGTIWLGFYNGLVQGFNQLNELVGLNYKMQPINIEDFKSSLDEAKKAVDDSGVDSPSPPAVAPKNNNLQQTAADAAAEKAAAVSAKKRAKREEKEAADLIKRTKRVEEIIQQLKKESIEKQLSEEDQKIAELSAKFDKQIAITKELEAKGSKEATQQRLELERIKEAELATLRQELFEEKQVADSEREAVEISAELERLTATEQAKREVEAEIKAAIQEELLSEREQELLDLETQLSEIMRIAEEHGIDTLDLELTFRKKKADAIKKFDEKDTKQLIESQKQRAQVLAQSFQAIGSVIGSTIDALGEKAKQNTILGKGLALTQIGISAAEAIAKGTASASGVPFPGNLVAIATTVATILANIASARKIINQKKKGRWTSVTGSDDGINYTAKYIGQSPTGMLDYNHPILMSTATGSILANEVGQEYFVNHTSLRIFSRSSICCRSRNGNVASGCALEKLVQFLLARSLGNYPILDYGGSDEPGF